MPVVKAQGCQTPLSDRANCFLSDQLNTNIWREWDNGYSYLQAGVISYGQKTQARLDRRGDDPAIPYPVACLLPILSRIFNAK